ncbi:MAG: hypothetical protein IKE46_04215 [Selenomonadaceae bacterium]|nr:hypothetical protein [Selenomonadaceae bacterium]MBR3746412.1 hypothetical protein [Selenomonadaceae bacterium]
MADTSVSYKCPNCGAPLSFMAGKKTVTCQFCGTEFEAGAIDEFYRDKNQRASQFTDEEIKNLQAFTCSSCGAEIVCDENTMATECVYCGNPTMIPKRFDGMLRPHFVIPFKKTKDDAVAALKKFYKGKKLLPSDFTANNRVEAIQPMYVPFWLFDVDISAQITFRAEKVKTRTTHVTKQKITEKKIFNCQREGTLNFEKIPADGSKRMNDDYMDSIEPFDFSELAEFSAAYLAGYLADKYDVSAEECAPRINERVENSTLAKFRNTVKGYDDVYVETTDIDKKFPNINYVMVPVWILTTRYQDKPYTFMMNGQTGKFVGALPYDSTKAIIWPALYMLAGLPVAYLLTMLILFLNQ